jgi:hypothetical protein
MDHLLGAKELTYTLSQKYFPAPLGGEGIKGRNFWQTDKWIGAPVWFPFAVLFIPFSYIWQAKA